MVNVPWNISGLSEGTYRIRMIVYDNTCGSTALYMNVNLIKIDPPTAW